MIQVDWQIGTMTAFSHTTRDDPALRGKLRLFRLSSDLQAVADLVELCFAETLDDSGRNYLRRMRSSAQFGAFLRWIPRAADGMNLPYMGYVWQEDGQVVGNVSLISFSVHGERRYLIANVAVHPHFRRRGIARQLTLAALRLARQHRVRSVWLQVREENEAALNLYRSLGFIERTRRTTWQSDGVTQEILPPDNVRLAPLDRRHWPECARWLSQGYPAEYAWHLQFDLAELRPDLWGALYRLLKGTLVRHFAAFMGDQLLGVASWQRSASRTHILWLAIPSFVPERVVAALLSQARRNLHPRVLSLEYFAHCLEQAFISAGFSARQTLIWMENLLE